MTLRTTLSSPFTCKVTLTLSTISLNAYLALRFPKSNQRLPDRLAVRFDVVSSIEEFGAGID